MSPSKNCAKGHRMKLHPSERVLEFFKLHVEKEGGNSDVNVLLEEVKRIPKLRCSLTAGDSHELALCHVKAFLCRHPKIFKLAQNDRVQLVQNDEEKNEVDPGNGAASEIGEFYDNFDTAELKQNTAATARRQNNQGRQTNVWNSPNESLPHKPIHNANLSPARSKISHSSENSNHSNKDPGLSASASPSTFQSKQCEMPEQEEEKIKKSGLNPNATSFQPNVETSQFDDGGWGTPPLRQARNFFPGSASRFSDNIWSGKGDAEIPQNPIFGGTWSNNMTWGASENRSAIIGKSGSHSQCDGSDQYYHVGRSPNEQFGGRGNPRQRRGNGKFVHYLKSYHFNYKRPVERWPGKPPAAVSPAVFSQASGTQGTQDTGNPSTSSASPDTEPLSENSANLFTPANSSAEENLADCGKERTEEDGAEENLADCGKERNEDEGAEALAEEAPGNEDKDSKAGGTTSVVEKSVEVDFDGAKMASVPMSFRKAIKGVLYRRGCIPLESVMGHVCLRYGTKWLDYTLGGHTIHHLKCFLECNPAHFVIMPGPDNKSMVMNKIKLWNYSNFRPVRRLISKHADPPSDMVDFSTFVVGHVNYELKVVSTVSGARESVDAITQHFFKHSEADKVLELGMKCLSVVSGEGVPLRHGKLSEIYPCILLVIGVPNFKPIHVFHLARNPEMMNAGIKELLQRDDLVKVSHQCKLKLRSLFKVFDVNIQNVFDINDAHLRIKSDEGAGISLHCLAKECNVGEGLVTIVSDEARIMTTGHRKFWLQHPLTRQMLEFCAAELLAMRTIFPILQRQLVEMNVEIQDLTRDVDGDIAKILEALSMVELKKKQKRTNTTKRRQCNRSYKAEDAEEEEYIDHCDGDNGAGSAVGYADGSDWDANTTDEKCEASQSDVRELNEEAEDSDSDVDLYNGEEEEVRNGLQQGVDAGDYGDEELGYGEDDFYSYNTDDMENDFSNGEQQEEEKCTEDDAHAKCAGEDVPNKENQSVQVQDKKLD